MNVSFSLPQWKANQLQKIDLKFQQQFYASTPYNLDDFKSLDKLSSPIFKACSSIIGQKNNVYNNSLIKQLINTENVSLGIFVAYLYEFIPKIIRQSETFFGQSTDQSSKQTSSNLLKIQSQIKNRLSSPESERKLIQINENQPKQNPVKRQYESLKQLKMKIYELDLCKISQIPFRFRNYYENNLLKKLIFQYLTKVLHNISLIQILLSNNQVLCFALSLISKSLYKKNNNQQVSYHFDLDFQKEVQYFLQYFDKPNVIEEIITNNINIKVKQPKNNKNVLMKKYLIFSLAQNKMKSKHVVYQKCSNEKYLLYLNKFQVVNSLSTKKSLIQQKKSLIVTQQTVSKRTNSSKKIITTVKQLKQLKMKKEKYKKSQIQTSNDWLDYLCCLKYFFTDTPKDKRTH